MGESRVAAAKNQRRRSNLASMAVPRSSVGSQPPNTSSTVAAPQKTTMTVASRRPTHEASDDDRASFSLSPPPAVGRVDSLSTTKRNTESQRRNDCEGQDEVAQVAVAMMTFDDLCNRDIEAATVDPCLNLHVVRDDEVFDDIVTSANIAETEISGLVVGAADQQQREEEEFQHWVSKIQSDWTKIHDAPAPFLANKEFLLTVVQGNGKILQHASLDLRNDKEVVIAAVQHRGRALKYASSQLQGDKEVVISAVKKDKRALQFAALELRKDKDVLMWKSYQHWLINVTMELSSLRQVPEHLYTDKSFVMQVLQSRYKEFECLIGPLRLDKDIVLAVVKQNPDMIKHVDAELQRDPDVLIAARMFDESHNNPDERQMTPKITLSTRFSLNQSSESEATNFTKLLKEHEYIQAGFNVYAPNAFDKRSCDENWTNFEWPCRGTLNTCQYYNILDDNLRPTDDCCWRYSYRHQLEESKATGGFILQLVEKGSENKATRQKLGKGQEIERDMAVSMQLKIFRVYRPSQWNCGTEKSFEKGHIDEVVSAIKKWYDKGCEDMSECDVRPGARIELITRVVGVLLVFSIVMVVDSFAL